MPTDRPALQTGRAAPLIVLAVAAVLLIAYIFWPEHTDPEADLVTEIPIVEAERREIPPQILDAPDIPRVEAPVTAPAERDEVAEETPSLPALNESDEEARSLLVAAANENETATEWLATDSLLRRGATAVDILSRRQLPVTALPISQPAGNFVVETEPDTGRIWLDPANYRRYDRAVGAVDAVSAERLVGIFHYFRPLLEQAYGELGYPEENFDNAIIAAIDHLLEAPVIDEPIELVHETVAYEYADENLENLSSPHRQFLRMGPDNTRRVQAKLREIRRLLLGSMEQQ